jgi:hypothetical protein
MAHCSSRSPEEISVSTICGIVKRSGNLPEKVHVYSIWHGFPAEPDKTTTEAPDMVELKSWLSVSFDEATEAKTLSG